MSMIGRVGFFTACATFVAIAVLVAASSASARKPYVVNGVSSDGWGSTSSSAERNLHSRYPGIATVTCFGAIISGDASASSFLHGLDRYWDKMVCGGQTTAGHDFALIYDAKGRSSWIIYRLSGVSITDLN